MKQESVIRRLEFAPSLGGILALSLALASCGGGGTGPSPAQPNPVPSITSLDPSSATAGGQAFTLTVNGSNFVSNSVVRWGGSDRTTSYQSSTRLTASILAGDIASVGDVEVTVFNPSPGGGTSNARTFSIGNPEPTLSSLSPSSVVAGASEFPLTVRGTNFLSSSMVRWNGSDRATNFVSSTQLTATIPASDVAVQGSAQVTVFNPAPGGGTSNSLTFAIENPVPTLTSLSPDSAVAAGPDFTLQAEGTNFVPSSVVRWDGSDRTTTFVNSSRLSAAIPASDIATTGTAQVSVFNPPPAGGTSGSLTFTISATPPLTLTTSRLPDTTGGKVYYFTLSASGGVPMLVDGVATYQWSVDAGNPPADLMLDSTTGRISGTVTGSTSSFTVRVTDFAAAPNSATRNFTLQVLPPPLGRNDACTPGSTAGTTQISNGRIRASFSPYGDLDVYSFQGTAGQQVTIEVFAQRLELDGSPATRDSWADTLLELLDDTCPPPALNGTNALAFNDDLSDPPNHVQDSRVVLTLPYTGPYFIRVRDFRGDGRPELIYELSLSGAD